MYSTFYNISVTATGLESTTTYFKTNTQSFS